MTWVQKFAVETCTKVVGLGMGGGVKVWGGRVRVWGGGGSEEKGRQKIHKKL
jgi:hypothetical protein